MKRSMLDTAVFAIMGSLIAVALILTLAASLSSCTAADGGNPAPLAYGNAGAKELYSAYCATCHGETGKGDGTASVYLFPKPRDFTTGKFKLRTTPTGTLPTDADLLKTITNGIPGSSMPSFEFLSLKDRQTLVGYVKDLAVREIEDVDGNGNPVITKMKLFEEWGQGEPIKVPQPPAKDEALLRLGKEVYFRTGVECWKCHGNTGEGDGPSAAELSDESGYPIQPNNFRQGIFKGGGGVEDIYTRFSTGLDGTPMPSYAGTLNDRERWALSYYIMSLSGTKPQAVVSHSPIASVKISGTISLDPLSKIWDNVKSSEIPLSALWQRSVFSRFVRVKSVHNDNQIAFLLEWEDDTVDGRLIKHQDFTDAAAIQFALTNPPGFFAMGEKGKPVNVWQWRFERQIDLAKFTDMEAAYPGMVCDQYQFAARSHLPGGEVTSTPSHDRTFITGWGAGNLVSDPWRASAAEDMYAEGFGTLASFAKELQLVQAKGVWVAGKWRVMFVRSLETSNKKAVQFGGRNYFVSFAVWDGSAKDRDGQKLVTYWQNLTLE